MELFPHKRVHKATWISLDGVTENQIDYILISKRWRTSLQYVRVKRGATIASDHHLLVASLKIKLAARKPFENTRRNFDVMKLRDPDTLTQNRSFKLSCKTGLNPYSFKEKKKKKKKKKI